MNAGPQAQTEYRKLVRRVRARVALSLLAATAAVLVQLFAGPPADTVSRWAAFTVAAAALTAAATLAHAQLSLGAAGSRDGFERLIRDVVGVRAS